MLFRSPADGRVGAIFRQNFHEIGVHGHARHLRIEVLKQPSFEHHTLQGASVTVDFAPPAFKRLAVDFILVDVADYPYHRPTCSSAHGFFMITGHLQQIDERGLEIINADILKTDLNALIEKAGEVGTYENVRIIGNLP